MLVDWGSLPLLPLGCVLKYLCTKDALVASSVCRHWRSALLMFGARMDMLKLRVSHMEKSCFLTRVFRKQVKLIYIFMDSSEEDLKHFMSNVFTQFYDMKMIKEITFVGPIYLQEEYFSPVFMLKRETLDSLPFNNLESLNLMGCTISPLESVKEDEYTCLESECDPLALSFNNVLKPGKNVNMANVTALSMIQILTIDYDFVDSDLVKRLSCLKQFHFLNIDVTDKSDIERKPLNWDELNTFFPRGLKICVSMICVPQSKFPKVMSHVLVEEMPLTSMKVLFCKTFCLAMLKLLTYYYKDTLRELVWVDSPFDPVLDKEILLKEASDDALEVANMFDPLVLLCWQCSELQRLVLHGAYYKDKDFIGYWIWHYDLVGCVRLRCLRRLDVSAVQVHELQRLRPRGPQPVPVLTTDSHDLPHRSVLRHISESMRLKWKPRSWRSLPPAVRGPASHADRINYILYEAKQTYEFM